MRIPLLIFCLVFVSVTTQQRPDTICLQCQRYCARDPSSNACKYCVKMGCQPSGFGPGIGGPDTVCIQCQRYCARDPSSNACKYCVKMECQPSGFGPGIGVSCGALITRPNVANLSKTDFVELSKTLGEVKRKKNSTGFESIARYHGKPYFCNKDQTGPPSPPLNENGCCIPHYNQDDRIDLFTPWHRLLEVQMEFAFRLKSHNYPLPMPYWDWTNPNPPGLPSLANYGEWINGPKPGGVTHRNPSPIPYEMLQSMVNTSYKQKTFSEFNAHIVQPHNIVHGKVGGDMATIGYASYDPIFYLHHSYVDYQYAYFQELQKLRQKKNVFKNPNFRMQPFNRDNRDNPFDVTRRYNTGPETEDYKGHFCYQFDSLKFMGKTPEEFHHDIGEERKKPSLFAAHLLKTTGITSILKFDLLPLKSVKYKYIGTLATFGSKDAVPDYSEPKIHQTILYDVTDSLKDPENEPKDKTLTFQMSKYTDVADKDLDISETYKPLVVYRAENTDTHVYRFHEDHIQDYPPKVQIKLGSKIEFLKADGSYSSSAYEILLNTNGTERIELVNGEFSIHKLEHKFIVQTSETIISVGYDVDYLIMCKDGVPISLDPDYLTVIPWNNDIDNDKPIYIRFGELVMFAWCPGTEASVYKFADETDYNDCNIPEEDRAPWSGDVRGYLIDTTYIGTQYFANGVGKACKNGWKITVDVIPVE